MHLQRKRIPNVVNFSASDVSTQELSVNDNYDDLGCMIGGGEVWLKKGGH